MAFDFGCVVPLEEEAHPFIRMLTDVTVEKHSTRIIYTGNILNKTISLIVSGCGKIKSASATQYLIDKYSAKTYIHFGTSGAISAKLKIGDIIIPDKVIEHDVIELFPKNVPPPVHRISLRSLKKILKNYSYSQLVWGAILSGDEDVITSNRKIELRRRFQGLSVDWESAGFTLTCQLNEVTGYVFRGVSDYAYEHTTSEYAKNQKIVINRIIRLLTYLFDSKDFGG